MTERPILFSASMVRAILEGRKTQTRRPVAPQPTSEWKPGTPRWYAPTLIGKNEEERPGEKVFGAADEFEGRRCPFGQPGDRLWVRETWQTALSEDGPCVLYGANCDRWYPKFARSGKDGLPSFDYDKYPGDYSGWASDIEASGPWRPSIHMPRWASRITLEITDVRVQRLQDITDSDAISEGFQISTCPAYVSIITENGGISSVSPNYMHGIPAVGDDWCNSKVVHVQHVKESLISSAKSNFLSAWQKIYGFDSSSSNPWIWALTFKVLAPEAK